MPEADENELTKIITGIVKTAYIQAEQEAIVFCEENRKSLKTRLTYLGDKIATQYAYTYDSLDSPDEQARFAKTLLHIGARARELMHHGWQSEQMLIDNELVSDSDITAEINYSISAFYNDLTGKEFGGNTSKQNDILLNAGMSKTFEEQFNHDALSLVWLCDADELMAKGAYADALDKISDAYYAHEFSNEKHLWEEWRALGDEEKKFSNSEMAKKRHAATYLLRNNVIAHWHEHIYPDNPKISNEKAGEWLKDSFTDLSVRKLAEYVAQAKKDLKKLPAASKA